MSIGVESLFAKSPASSSSAPLSRDRAHPRRQFERLKPDDEEQIKRIEEFNALLDRSSSPADIINSHPSLSQFRSRESLRRIFLLWERKASREEWAWLEERLRELVEDPERSRHQDDQFVYALYAFCLARPTANGEIRRDQALAVIDQIQSLPRPFPDKSTPYIVHSLIGLVYSACGDWRAAENRIYRALGGKDLDKMPYPDADIRCLELYRDALIAAGRIEDFAEAISSKHRGISPILYRNSIHTQFRPEFARVIASALAALPDPLEWLEDKIRREKAAFIAEERSSSPRKRVVVQEADGIEDDVDEEGDGAPVQAIEVSDPFSTQLKATAQMLFVALTYDSSTSKPALAVFRRLTKLGVKVSPHHAVDLCIHLEETDQRRNIKSIHQRMMLQQPDMSYGATRRFLYILLHHNFPLRAYKFFRKMLVRFPDMPLAHQTAIAAYHCSRGDKFSASKMIKLIFGAEVTTHVEALKLLLEMYTSSGDKLNADKVVHALKGQYKKPSHLEVLINVFARRGEPSNALFWFNQFLTSGGRPTVEIFSAFIRLFARQGDMRNIDKIVQGAIDAGVPITGEFCAKVLDAGVNCQDWITVARRWASFPERIRAHPAVSASILRAFVHLAVPFDSLMTFFRQIPDPTRRHWNLIMLGACDAGRMDVASQLLNEMVRRHLRRESRVEPDVSTYSILMHGHLRRRDQVAAKEVYDAMRRRHVLPSSVTYAMILSAYLEDNYTGVAADQAHLFAKSVFRLVDAGKMPERGLARSRIPSILYSRLIDVSGRLGRTENAQQYFDTATRYAPPTIALQSQLMLAYRRSNEFNAVFSLWNETFQHVTESHGDREDIPGLPRSNILCVPLSITLDALGRAARHDDVIKTWNSVRDAGFGLDAGNYNHYAIALMRCGDIYSAFWIVEGILKKQEKEILSRRRAALRRSPHLESIEGTRLDDEDVDAEARADPEAEEEDRTIDAADVRYFMRESARPAPVDPNDIDEIPFAPSSPSDSRPSNRAVLQERFGSGDPLTAGRINFDAAQALLQTWRPGDANWRPSLLLRSLLYRAFKDLHTLRKQRRTLAQKTKSFDPEAGPDPLQPHYVTLPSFGVPIRTGFGPVVRTTPRQVILTLVQRFPSTIKWLERFDRQQARASAIKAERAVADAEEATKSLAELREREQAIGQRITELERAGDLGAQSDQVLQELQELQATLTDLQRQQQSLSGLPTGGSFALRHESATPTGVSGTSLPSRLFKGRQRRSARLLGGRNAESWKEFTGLRRKYIYTPPPWLQKARTERKARAEAAIKKEEERLRASHTALQGGGAQEAQSADGAGAADAGDVEGVEAKGEAGREGVSGEVGGRMSSTAEEGERVEEK